MEENNGNNNHYLPQPSSSQLPPPPLYYQSMPLPSYSLPLPYSPQMRNYWIAQMGNATDVKHHAFPLTRIKKIMKSNPEVNMVTAEAPVLISKACEMLILDLTMRSWLHTVEGGRQTLKRSDTLTRSDISAATTRSFKFTFLGDVVPRDPSVVTDDPVLHLDGEVLPPGTVIGYPVFDCNGVYASPPQMQEWPAVPGDGEEAAGEIGGSSGGN
ncbi:Nuclear transcription factor Y subunit C-7 [Arabidopsis thaliana]|uniref:NF-YC7 n=3 Tax=Arabidopsis TaxID=3701 RepID=A0A178UBR1_ARATH|nr:NF-YC7 [Arabidopsis thaliana]